MNVHDHGLVTGQWREWLTPEPGALSFVPASFARQYKLLPLKLEGDKLVCATYEPVDLAQLGEAQFKLQRELTLVRVPQAAFQSAVDFHCGRKAMPELSDLVDSVTVRDKKPKRRIDRSKASLDWASRPTKVIAVTGGKGGVGKTAFSCNVAVALAQAGLRVAILDADFTAPNVHVALAIKPEVTLADVIARRSDLTAAMQVGPAGVHVLCGEPGANECAAMHYAALSELGAGYGRFGLEHDALIVDTGAGAHPNTISMLHMADEVVVVLSPDPTGVNDAFVTVKAALAARPDHKISIVVNRARTEKDAKDLYGRFRSFIGPTKARIEFRGWIPDDKAVATSVKFCQPFMLREPRSKASRAVREIAAKLAATEVTNSAPLQAAGWSVSAS